MAAKIKRSPKYEVFRSVLRRAGYKATPSRLTVLEIFKKTGRPLSPQAVIDKAGKNIDQATIYRIIKTLKTIGAIRQIDFRHNHAHYELSDTGDHHHCICLVCGHSEEITGCEIDAVMKEAVLRQARSFSEIKDHSLEFYGTCKRCAKGSY